MSFRDNNIGLVAACICMAASAVYCAPTISSQTAILNPSISNPVRPAELTCPFSNNFNSNDGLLSVLGSQFITPSASTESLANLAANSVKSLPAVPAAVFMVVFGFFCVSFVKDRRFWLAALAAILWIGNTGFQALPQLAQRFGHSNKQLFLGELNYISTFDDYSRSRSNLEGTEYIGLLHHLAGIPHSQHISFNTNLSTLIAFSQKTYAKVCDYPQNNTYSFPFGFLPERYSLNLQLSCLASKAEQSIVFSPEFIFNLMPRGPPQFTSKSFHTIGV